MCTMETVTIDVERLRRDMLSDCNQELLFCERQKETNRAIENPKLED